VRPVIFIPLVSYDRYDILFQLIKAVADHHIVSEWDPDNCVELFVAKRYSGNLKIADRMAPGRENDFGI
jgi:hypothetical protein